MADGSGDRKKYSNAAKQGEAKAPARLLLPQAGTLGLYVDPSPLHAPPGGWRRLSNAEFAGMSARSIGRSMGGMRKRGGISPWTSAALTGGDIMAAASIALPSALDLTPTLLVGANRATGASSGTAWFSSTDGADFATTILTSATPRPFYMGAGIAGLSNQPPPGPLTYRGALYYAADDYARVNPATEYPPLAIYQAAQGYEFWTPPSLAGDIPFQMTALMRIGTTLYIAVLYGSSVTGTRVYTMDLLDGTVETLPTPPDPVWCLASYQGRIWAGTLEGLSSGQGGVYSINPDTDTTWTLEHQNSQDGRRGVYHLHVWNGELFAYGGNYDEPAVAAQIERRSAAGVWSTVLTAPTVGNPQWFHPGIIYDGRLYAGWTVDAATEDSRIYSTTDGATWNAELSITSTYAFKRPGWPQILNDELYWPCFGPVAGDNTDTDDFVLKRTSAGVWSQVLTGVGLNGTGALYYPSAG